ncbi:hypothetical protein DACRYDRAFT_22039 [Dacryopinax primogenitus]|uniref:Hydrophobin n=1 Tax=Dacryopinax primogenitus (strain DJM 731) TaxID=1858805 RepID=M5FWP3_DACPD|nr:uncharacterized protein DACRYDRAFT_22039 [Dacryopinax primogenitus]EJU02371.1 hypothetical protein DACRYDRAFT_22039 [Dacryopinax primogenitus]
MYCRPSFLALLAFVSVAFAFPVARPTDFGSSRAGAAVRRAAAINFGTCSDPQVTEANGVFSVANTKDFGSVASSKFLDEVVTGICNVLTNNCGVDGITEGDCSTAASDAIGAGNVGLGADEFNSVLGFTSNFAATAAAGAGNNAVVSATTTAAATKATHTNVAAAGSSHGNGDQAGHGGSAAECPKKREE